MLPTIPLNTIFTALAKTPGGKYLKTAVRYDKYREPHETVAFWKSVLGPTAVTFSHMKHMVRITKSLMTLELQHDSKRFSVDNQRKLLLGVACHDYGEAILDGEGIGDVLFVFKTGEESETEKRMCARVLSSLELDDGLKSEMLEAYHDVVIDQQSDLYQFFRDVEQTEYLMAGINVYIAGLNSKKIVNDKILIGNTLGPNLGPILQNAGRYPSIAAYLRSRTKEISEMFEYTAADYKASTHPIKSPIGDIDESFDAWQKFIFSG